MLPKAIMLFFVLLIGLLIGIVVAVTVFKGDKAHQNTAIAIVTSVAMIAGLVIVSRLSREQGHGRQLAARANSAVDARKTMRRANVVTLACALACFLAWFGLTRLIVDFPDHTAQQIASFPFVTALLTTLALCVLCRDYEALRGTGWWLRVWILLIVAQAGALLMPDLALQVAVNETMPARTDLASELWILLPFGVVGACLVWHRWIRSPKA